MVRLCRRGVAVRVLGPLGVLVLLVAALAASTSNALGQGQGPHEMGRWDPVGGPGGSYDWPPGFSMHLVRIPGGVLAWHNPASGQPQPYLWDGAQFTPIKADLPLGCSGHARLSDGSFLVTGGGDPNTNCYPSVDNATKFLSVAPGGWVAVAPMHHKRWYPTATTLPPGTILTTSGKTERG